MKDNCRIMAGECPDTMSVRDIGDHSYFGYLVVDGTDGINGINNYHERVRSLGAELIKPLRDEPWGMREFGVRTIDSHRIMIGAKVAPTFPPPPAPPPPTSP